MAADRSLGLGARCLAPLVILLALVAYSVLLHLNVPVPRAVATPGNDAPAGTDRLAGIQPIQVKTTSAPAGTNRLAGIRPMPVTTTSAAHVAPAGTDRLAGIRPTQVKTTSATPVQLPAPPGKAPPPPIRSGTFVYLVLGAGLPERRWLRRAGWEDVSLLYMSWRENVTKAVAGMGAATTFRYAFYPKSTWTTSRNRQASMAHAWEREQRWRFEYLVFFDSDVVLSYRMPKRPGHVIKNLTNDDAAVRRLNAILLRDRPMKAGLGFNEFKWNADNFRCQRRCQVDNSVQAYHATASHVMEPYSGHFDSSSWWASAYMLNMYVAALAADFCHTYLEVLAEQVTNVHGKYPKSQAWSLAIQHVNKCFAQAGMQGFSEQSSLDEMKLKLETSLDPTPGGWPKCQPMAAGVDYGALLQARNSSARWRKCL